MIAFLFSILAVFLLLPSFNSLVKKDLFPDLSQPIFWIGSILIIAVTGVIAGSYPALYLSSFKPIKVLKGNLLQGKNRLRKIGEQVFFHQAIKRRQH